MLSLSQAARRYLYVVWVIAAVVFISTIPSMRLADHAFLLVICALAFAIADYYEFSFEVTPGHGVAMTIADAPTIFLVAVTGHAGILAIAGGTLVADLLNRRPWYKIAFNIATRTITYQVLMIIYTLGNGPNAPPFSGPFALVTFILMAAMYYALNTLLVSTVVAFATRQQLLRVYRDSYRTVHWVHFATTPFGVLLAVLLQYNPWLLPISIAPLIMLQRWFKTVVALQTESKLNARLARESQQLASKLERLQSLAAAMIASDEPDRLIDTVSTRLATLLDARAHWAVLLDEQPARLLSTTILPPGWTWSPDAYRAELQRLDVHQVDAQRLAELHPGAALWPSLVVIPLVIEQQTIGGICLALGTTTPLSDSDRRVLLGFASQVARAVERVRLFTELQVKQDELVRSSKLAALGTFAAGIGHEFNNLLAGVLGHAQLGLSSDSVAEKNEALEVAVRMCLRGRSITSGLLTFARRRSTQHELTRLSDLIRETATLVERELGKENIVVELHLHEVPPTLCDPGQIAQVLLNLITNARDAMREKGSGTITIELNRHGPRIELAVSDTGCGIPPEMIDQIFQPFVTTKGAMNASSTPGTGLGLAISHGIIEGHGGTIRVRSIVGQGTTMIVTLPIISDRSGTQDQRFDRDILQGLRVLLVEDELNVAQALARLMQAEGMQVTIATDGREALDHVRRASFDLVISDIVMPIMDGETLARQLAAQAPELPVVLMTGHNGTIHPHPPSPGIKEVLEKPFTFEQLIEMIGRVALTMTRR
ncbi:MAG: response regulator [Chloroflexi bacterium]|nr:response regulator [Chloroflexota bacterium]